MKNSVRVWLIIAASFVALGCIMLGGTLAMVRWDITKLSSGGQTEINEHVLNNEFSEITVVADTDDVEIIPSDKEYAYVVCQEKAKQKHSVEIKDKELVIKLEDTRKWYERIGIFFDEIKITVYLPKGQYGDLSVKISTGDVKISEALEFKGIDVDGGTGDVTCSALAKKHMNIKVSTGDIKITNVSAPVIGLSTTTGDISLEKVVCDGEVTVNVSTGDTRADEVTCKSFVTTGTTGDVNMSNVVAEELLSLDVHTGSISFDGCDAAEIRMTTSTGDVKGSLLSGKIFTVKTETGSIDVPDSTGGGSCKVTTTTGSIKIQIK